MDELRVVRREEGSLIVATETGEEFRLIVDSSVLAELRSLARQLSGGTRVSPREIQKLVRSGKTRDEICEITGADESDIERYEEPVLAERRFILSTAQSVPVRTHPSEIEDESFGSVIAQRLSGLQASEIEWDSWRDEEAGWMIGLTFNSHEVAHKAVWGFEHRKNVLSPVSPDAVSLSKQGEVGDRLIPKLRAVDDAERSGRFDSGAFARDEVSVEPEGNAPSEHPGDADETETPSATSPGVEAARKAGHPSTGSIPVIDANAEFARRREIDQRAIKSTEPELPDLGQTADLLEALRKRRGEREASAFPAQEIEEDHAPVKPVPLRNTEAPVSPSKNTPSSSTSEQTRSEQQGRREQAGSERAESTDQQLPIPGLQAEDAPETERKSEPKGRAKGRTSIPSWDDILFGTRGEDD